MAASRLAEFVKEEKRYDGLLDAEIVDNTFPYRWNSGRYMEKAGTAMVLVEEYVESFKRDVPMEMKAEIRQHQTLFDSFCSGSCVTALVWRLREAFEIYNLTTFVVLYVNELDRDYLLILKLRKELFKRDDLSMKKVGCDIDPEFSRSEDHIKWSVNEPEITTLE